MSDHLLRPARIVGLLALALMGYGCFLILKPFLSALLWAAILVFTTWPLFRMLRERTGWSPGWAALVMVLAEFLLIGLPLVFATPTSREDVDGLRASAEDFVNNGVPAMANWARGLPVVGEWIGAVLGRGEASLSGVFASVRPYFGNIATNALSIILTVLSGIAELLLAIFLAFFLYRDGPRMAKYFELLGEKIAGDRARRLITLVGNVTRGVVYGLLGTAVVQGALCWIGFWIAGVPRAALLGVLAGIASIIPVGAPIVWVPVALWLFTQGQTGWGIFILVYGGVFVGSSDNVIRPLLISQGADLPLLLTLLGAIGGVLAFGFLGLFLGPVLLAVGFTVLRDWAADGSAATKA